MEDKTPHQLPENWNVQNRPRNPRNPQEPFVPLVLSYCIPNQRSTCRSTLRWRGAPGVIASWDLEQRISPVQALCKQQYGLGIVTVIQGFHRHSEKYSEAAGRKESNESSQARAIACCRRPKVPVLHDCIRTAFIYVSFSLCRSNACSC
jgi:hypothetical protein